MPLKRRNKFEGKINIYLREKVWKRDGYTCQYCGYNIYDFSESKQLSVDHIVPYSYALSLGEDNLITSCMECNQKISNKIFNSLEEKKEYIRNLNNYCRGNKNFNCKLKEEEVILIRISKLSVKELSKIYNVSVMQIRNIKNRINWKHI